MKLPNKYLIFLTCFFLLLPISSMGSDQQTLKRGLDPIIIKGSQITEALGKPILKYGLYALKNSVVGPVPFQIDEVDDKGNFILTHGENKSLDKDNGVFDSNDELVFMAKDTGDKISGKEVLPSEGSSSFEIEVMDPDTNEKGWAYLVVFDTPPKGSEVDYVSYDPKDFKLSAFNYTAEFNSKFPAAPSNYTFNKTIGGDGQDFLDRVRVRVLMKLILTIKRNEEDIQVKELGYIDGPIRVVLHTKNITPLFLGIPASSTFQDTFFYFNHADFPFVASFPPVKPNEFKVKIIDDFIDFKGWTFYNSNNLKGNVINGKVDKADKELDLSPYSWSVISNGINSFWSRTLKPSGCPVKIKQYFNDNMAAKDSHEDVLGELPGIGSVFSDGWEDLKESLVEFRLIHFFTRGYIPGQEKEIVNVHDKLLKVSVSRL